MNTAEQLEQIKAWLKTGSINIFGLPMSGKDTVGVKLAEDLSAKFLSSGIIIREYEAKVGNDMTKNGQLIPTNLFYDIILPYFGEPSIKDQPLVLSSVGRWFGEEDKILETTSKNNHEIKAVILLDLSEDEVRHRWEAAKTLGDRGNRSDDLDPATFETRIKEFHEKTEPVLNHYNDLGLLIKVNGNQSREEVYASVLSALSSRVRL